MLIFTTFALSVTAPLQLKSFRISADSLKSAILTESLEIVHIHAQTNSQNYSRA